MTENNFSADKFPAIFLGRNLDTNTMMYIFPDGSGAPIPSEMAGDIESVNDLFLLKTPQKGSEDER